jgi:hypothetical protein
VRSPTAHRAATASSKWWRAAPETRVGPSPGRPHFVRHDSRGSGDRALPGRPTSCSSGGSKRAAGGRSIPPDHGTSSDSSASARVACEPCVPLSQSCGRRDMRGSWPRSSIPTARRLRSCSRGRSAPLASYASGNRRRRQPRSRSSSDAWSPMAGGWPGRSGRSGTRFPCGDRERELMARSPRSLLRRTAAESA